MAIVLSPESLSRYPEQGGQWLILFGQLYEDSCLGGRFPVVFDLEKQQQLLHHGHLAGFQSSHPASV